MSVNSSFGIETMFSKSYEYLKVEGGYLIFLTYFFLWILYFENRFLDHKFRVPKSNRRLVVLRYDRAKLFLVIISLHSTQLGQIPSHSKAVTLNTSIHNYDETEFPK